MPSAFGGVGAGFTNPMRWVDISNVFYEIVPLKKPLFHMIADGPPPEDRYFQWARRTYTTSGQNRTPIGGTFVFDVENKLPVLDQFNYIQIFSKMIRVSDVEQYTKHYAIDDMSGDQEDTELAIMGTEIEHALWRESLQSVALGNMTTPSMQGVLMAIFCGVSTYTNVAGIGFSESMLNATLARLWSDFGSEPQDGWLNARLQNLFSTFTGQGTQTRFIEADRTTAIFSIIEYQSAFQPVHLHLARDVFQGTASTGATTPSSGTNLGCSFVMLDHTMLKKRWMEQVVLEPAPRTALSHDAVAHCILSLEWGHPNAHYWIANLSVA